MGSRSRWVVVAVVLLLTIAAGTAYVVTSAHTGSRPQATPTPSPPPARSAAMLPLTSTTIPTSAGITAALARLVADPAFGRSLVGEVVDATTGDVLYARAPVTLLPPASTAKLLTAIAALHVLGPDVRLHTTVVRDGTTVYLVGGGDVTLTAKALKGLAARVGTASRVCIDTSAWTGPAQAPGWTPAYLADGDIARLSPLEVGEARLSRHSSERAADPAMQAASIFATAIGTKVLCHATAPTSATTVATADSPPIAALVQGMLTTSDNDLAEALGRAVAHATGNAQDFAGEAAAITTAIGSLGVATSGFRLVDASGLSRLDRVSAATLVTLLRLATGQADLAPSLQGLPIAGATGTLDNRYRKGSALSGAGVVRAKTGNLIGVDTLAGLVVDADGRLLVFAFLTDRAASPSTGEAALDRLAAALAGCGCR